MEGTFSQCVVDGTALALTYYVRSKVLESPELANAVLLVFANKQDLPHAFSAEEVQFTGNTGC